MSAAVPQSRNDRRPGRRQPAATPDQRNPTRAALHQAGRFDEAAQICGAILATEPDDYNALHLLGLLRHKQGRTPKRSGLSARCYNARSDPPKCSTIMGLFLRRLRATRKRWCALTRCLRSTPIISTRPPIARALSSTSSATRRRSLLTGGACEKCRRSRRAQRMRRFAHAARPSGGGACLLRARACHRACTGGASY